MLRLRKAVRKYKLARLRGFEAECSTLYNLPLIAQDTEITSDLQKINEVLSFETQSILGHQTDLDTQQWDECTERMLGLVKKIAKLGTPTPPSKLGNYLFHLACEKEDVEALRALLQWGADPNESIYKPDCTVMPLNIACEKGNLEVARLLVENGALVDAGEYGYKWPLLVACMKGYFAVARFLIDSGSKVEDLSRDRMIGQPLHHACKYSSKEAQDVVFNLILRGAKVDVEMEADMPYNTKLQTPLHTALSEGNSLLALTLVTLCGPTVLPPVKWTPYTPTPTPFHTPSHTSPHTDSHTSNHTPSHTPPPQDPLAVIVRHNRVYPSPPKRYPFVLPPTLSAQDLYEQVRKESLCDWVQLCFCETVIFPGNQTLEEMGFPVRGVVQAYSGITISPWILSAKKNIPLLHNYTSNKFWDLPKPVRDSIFCLLLIAKRQRWCFDKIVLYKIIDYLCFGWLQNKNP